MSTRKKHKPIGPKLDSKSAIVCQMERVLAELSVINNRLKALETPIHHWWDNLKRK